MCDGDPHPCSAVRTIKEGTTCGRATPMRLDDLNSGEDSRQPFSQLDCKCSSWLHSTLSFPAPCRHSPTPALKIHIPDRLRLGTRRRGLAVAARLGLAPAT